MGIQTAQRLAKHWKKYEAACVAAQFDWQTSQVYDLERLQTNLQALTSQFKRRVEGTLASGPWLEDSLAFLGLGENPKVSN